MTWSAEGAASRTDPNPLETSGSVAGSWRPVEALATDSSRGKFSATGVPFRPLEPADLESSISARFRAVARMLPGVPALVSPGHSLTFAEADARADQAAAVLLAELGAGDEPVATLLPHSVGGLVGMLAALRTGRPLVMLDPMVPAARLGQILRQSGAVGCLTDPAGRPVLEEAGATVPLLDLEEVEAHPAAAATVGGLSPAGTPFPGDLGGADAVAAVVFTSGSTGEPKGVVWTNGTLVNDAYAGMLALGFAPGDRAALVLPYAFAAGFTVVGFALLNGVGLYAYDPRSLGIRDLPDWITSNELTTLHTTPSLLRSLVGALDDGAELTSLRLVTTCGEAVYGGDIAAIRPYLPPTAVYTNWSGSSEVASLAFFEIAPGEQIPEGTIPAGWPAAGKDVTIEREDGGVVPAGETGDVVVSSHFLAAGYWNAPELSAAKFSRLPDGRLRCATGDLGRFEPDGRLLLLGRRDAAVKVRGYLVEPSEIESALLALPEIAEAVVVAVRNPPEPNRLVAYIVPRAGDTTLSAAAIRRKLRMKLPTWMVPASIVPLPALPRTERGKVDRRALPEPPARSGSFRIPETQWEMLLADLWCRVLELEQVGVDDDFIELGGDSLAAEELRTLIAEEVGVRLPVTALVDAPTLGEFARKVSVAQRSGPAHPTIVPLRAGGTRPPLFCVAGAAQLALAYLSLARHLGDDQGVYAFQAHGFEQRGIPDWSVERAARRFVQLMRVIQPYGPYYVVGHSLGGLIALEMAQQLAAAGEEVALLTLLDSYLPASLRLAGDEEAARADGARQEAVPPAQARDTVADTYRRRMRSLRKVLLPEDPRNLFNKDTLLRMAQLPLTGLLVLPGLDEFDAFFAHGRMLERYYRPKPWAGRALVYRAMHNPDPAKAWSRYLTGSHDYHDVPTEHFSMMREPHIVDIARGIRAEMDSLIERHAAVGTRRGR
ncbi:non-ribosomal peptide synthetase [Frankia sp. CNm7]|uniref:Non-ribosomal peptide synthetase n=1 Tax=Frankia nepalensis TaxID=1836974 RepID=A0A937RH70_9ACTN|nr:non-ribosomal peptide synthetase [Frankia nepalensis]MBL7495405.1 non-ribosomal peptide synthetase [Frankia nepalensis]MBL7514837.1 non-ribosomal peptide synthetase [Frankia nepalensis]MBL7519845.1 non-ribosomal peptide synthetase [Frankia nepalensis]MBL7625961.1 non-ribosomal peptide synthetase [Frankia nepalensis]